MPPHGYADHQQDERSHHTITRTHEQTVGRPLENYYFYISLSIYETCYYEGTTKYERMKVPSFVRTFDRSKATNNVINIIFLS